MPVIAIVDDNDPFRHATASFIGSSLGMQCSNLHPLKRS